MKVIELIEYLTNYNGNSEVLMRDFEGEWCSDITVDNIGQVIFLCGKPKKEECDSLKNLAAREAQ